MRLPDGLGLELLQRMAAQQRGERCVVMTAYGSAENAVEALKAGAFDYLTKPVDLKQFRSVVASAIHEPAASGAGRDRPDGGGEPAARAPAPRSSGWSAIRADAAGQGPHRKVARSMAPVLVRGESGTGKELAARAIHACSHRADGPFVAVNCGAIPRPCWKPSSSAPQGLLHRRRGRPRRLLPGRARRHAVPRRDRRPAAGHAVQAAARDPGAQVRRSARPQEDAVDVRIVSATHRDLAADVQAGRFRQDLFYRLNVIEILVPPLRERREDLPALCEALLARIAQEPACRRRRCRRRAGAAAGAPAARQRARAREPAAPRRGAVRRQPAAGGLRAVAPLSPARRAAGAARAAAAPPGRGSARRRRAPAARSDLQAYLDQQEREILVKALQETGFNRTAAAQRLGLSLRQIRYRIARLAIATPGGDEPDDAAVPDPHALWAGGWYRFARRLDSPNFGPRPAGAQSTWWWCIRSACRPAVRRRRGAAPVHQHAGLGRAPLFPADRGHAGVGALLRAARRRAVAVRQLRRPRLACRPSHWRGRDNCNDDSVGIELEGLEGEPSSRRSTRRWPRCAPALAQHYPIAPCRRPRAHRAGPQARPGRGFDWGPLPDHSPQRRRGPLRAEQDRDRDDEGLPGRARHAGRRIGQRAREVDG
jgi:two-component system response regulator PilR (NtrC family)